jgi:hypothetical protein
MLLSETFGKAKCEKMNGWAFPKVLFAAGDKFMNTCILIGSSMLAVVAW